MAHRVAEEVDVELDDIWLYIARQSGSIVIVGKGQPEDVHRLFIGEHGLRELSYVVSDDLFREYQILETPYAVLLDQMGRVAVRRGLKTLPIWNCSCAQATSISQRSQASLV